MAERRRQPNTRPRTGAIVLGGNFVGLGVVRSLAAAGVPTWVFDTAPSKAIVQYSRYPKRVVFSTENIHELLLREGRAHGLDGWVVFPVTDEYVEACAQHHDSLSAMYRLTTPPLNVTAFALDKRLTYRKAAELGIPAPWTSTPAAAMQRSLEAFASELPYPVILKPAVNHHFFPHTNVKALAVGSAAEFHQRLAQMLEFIPPEEILIQELIPGDGDQQFSFCAICDSGRCYATLVARRRRQYPLQFGNASTFVQTAAQSIVESDGRRFLESIGYDGIAEIEFKLDPRDGKYKILDFNPRAWGWHSLGRAAGIDFSRLLWQQKTSGETSPASVQRQVTWIREITDLVAVAKSPQRGIEIRRFLSAAWNSKLTLATFDVFDPIPFFAELAAWIVHGTARQQKAKDFIHRSAQCPVRSS